MLYRRYKTNFIVKLLGQWQDVEYGAQSIPIAGLAYYISPPRDMHDIMADPFHTVCYIVFVLASCALFSKYWIEISGESAKEVARKLKDESMILQGHRDTSMVKTLSKYIPIAAACGGICIGALTIIADFMGAIGSGFLIIL